jgi:RNA polymerase sigma-70 factor (ECF subfamily)
VPDHVLAVRLETVVPGVAAPGPAELSVRRAQAGDERAFAELYQRHVARIYALCLRLEADQARAAERTQDVFVRAWERLGTFRGESSFGTWLHRLAVNLVIQHRRSVFRRERWSVSTAEPEAFEQAGTGASHEPMDLEAAIARLPAGARLVFVLHDVEGYTHEEIAERAGIAAGTSKAQLFRARRLLREMLNR